MKFEVVTNNKNPIKQVYISGLGVNDEVETIMC